ncbi:S-layer homology domain-containing protein [Cohnella thailandensis]
MPYSMEYFYIPLNDVMTGENRFDWTKLEDNLDVIASRGHQSVLRFYLDYPNRPTGIPQYLLDAGLATHSYADYDNGAKATSVSPDYDDPRLVKALDDFIAAFGERYDGDPRIGFIMVGLIGFWGEWHTYPHAEGADNWMPSEANQKRVLEDMDEAFDETKLVVRNPISSGELQTKAFDIGYHDDSFAYETLPVSEGGESWHFWGRVINANDTAFWQTRPMGGEMRPEIQIAMWDRDPPGTSDGEDYYKSLKYTHASWLIDHAVFKTPMSGQPLERAREGSRSLGYEYYVPAAYLDGSSGKVKVGVEIENRGVAPFYYDWKVELAVRDGAGIQTVLSPDWKISGVLPNDPDAGIVNNKLLEAEDAPTLTNGDYEVLLRVVNPLSAAHDNAVRFRFANEEQGADGWLLLGSVKVTNGKEPSPGVVTGPDTSSGGSTGVVPGADGRVSVAEDGTVPLAAFKAAVDAGVGAADAEHRVILQVAAGADADAVVLSAETLAYAKEWMPDGVLDVRTTEASYELPLGAIDLAALAKKLDTRTGDLSLVIEVRVELSNAQLEAAAARQGLKLVGIVVDFKVLARADGREAEVTDFGGAYVTRTIRLPSAVDAARATGVALDPATGALVFVPTVFEVEGEVVKAVLKRMGNSLYAVASGSKSFDDVNGSSAKADIESLAAKQIVQGRTERLYAPEAPVSRAEFVALLVRSLGLPAAEPAGAFADVREGAWYASAVEAAARVGLVRGAGDGKFRPADVVTREEAAVLLAGAARIAGMSIGATQAGLSANSDGDDVHSWAREALSAALVSGLLKPKTANRLSPGEELTREQAAVSLTAFLRQAGFIG